MHCCFLPVRCPINITRALKNQTYLPLKIASMCVNGIGQQTGKSWYTARTLKNTAANALLPQPLKIA